MEIRTDWSDYEFRAHAVGNLMVGVGPNLTANQEKQLATLLEKREAGKITDKQLITLGDLLKKRDAKPELSKTAKSYVESLFLTELYGAPKRLSTRATEKGIVQEEQSITLYSEVMGRPFFKNKERRGNGWIQGEPDNAAGKIRDIKTSWSSQTFPIFDTEIKNQLYKWQLDAYMELWGYDEAELIYCLVDTPDELIEREIVAQGYKMGYGANVPERIAEEIERSMKFSHVPDPLRVKIFEQRYDKTRIYLMKQQVELAREYMTQLSEQVKDGLIGEIPG